MYYVRSALGGERVGGFALWAVTAGVYINIGGVYARGSRYVSHIFLPLLCLVCFATTVCR